MKPSLWYLWAQDRPYSGKVNKGESSVEEGASIIESKDVNDRSKGNGEEDINCTNANTFSLTLPITYPVVEPSQLLRKVMGGAGIDSFGHVNETNSFVLQEKKEAVDKTVSGSETNSGIREEGKRLRLEKDTHLASISKQLPNMSLH